jgi:hypothetical protein
MLSRRLFSRARPLSRLYAQQPAQKSDNPIRTTGPPSNAKGDSVENDIRAGNNMNMNLSTKSKKETPDSDKPTSNDKKAVNIEVKK